MRILLDEVLHLPSGTEPDEAELAALYEIPRAPWWRANFVQTVDGAATGPDGRTGTINTPVDEHVFHLLRRLADAVVVGAGTARVEGYEPGDEPLIVVSRSGSVPSGLAGAAPGQVTMVTCADVASLEAARDLLGDDHVLVLGEATVDLGALRETLTARGLTRVLCEGGPHLLSSALAAGVVDELCTTQVPRLIGGVHPRITADADSDVDLDLRLLLTDDSSLLARWFVRR